MIEGEETAHDTAAVLEGLTPEQRAMYEDVKEFKSEVLASLTDIIYARENLRLRMNTVGALSVLFDSFCMTMNDLSRMMKIKEDLELTPIELERLFEQKATDASTSNVVRALQSAFQNR